MIDDETRRLVRAVVDGDYEAVVPLLDRLTETGDEGRRCMMLDAVGTAIFEAGVTTAATGPPSEIEGWQRFSARGLALRVRQIFWQEMLPDTPNALGVLLKELANLANSQPQNEPQNESGDDGLGWMTLGEARMDSETLARQQDRAFRLAEKEE